MSIITQALQGYVTSVHFIKCRQWTV